MSDCSWVVPTPCKCYVIISQLIGTWRWPIGNSKSRFCTVVPIINTSWARADNFAKFSLDLCSNLWFTLRGSRNDLKRLVAWTQCWEIKQAVVHQVQVYVGQLNCILQYNELELELQVPGCSFVFSSVRVQKYGELIIKLKWYSVGVNILISWLSELWPCILVTSITTGENSHPDKCIY